MSHLKQLVAQHENEIDKIIDVAEFIFFLTAPLAFPVFVIMFS